MVPPLTLQIRRCWYKLITYIGNRIPSRPDWIKGINTTFFYTTFPITRSSLNCCGDNPVCFLKKRVK